jgi:hypothetical protein
LCGSENELGARPAFQSPGGRPCSIRNCAGEQWRNPLDGSLGPWAIASGCATRGGEKVPASASSRVLRLPKSQEPHRELHLHGVRGADLINCPVNGLNGPNRVT